MRARQPTNKYGAKKVIVTTDGTMFEIEQLKKYNITDVTGIKFDSKMEARFYLHILDRQKEGYYTLTEIQPKYVLQEKPKITYIADFLITYPNGEQFVVDVKGHRTAAFNIKARMFRAKYPELKLLLVTGNSHKWEFKEVG